MKDLPFYAHRLIAVGGFGWEDVVVRERVVTSLAGALLHFSVAAAVAGAQPTLVSRCPKDVAHFLLPRLARTGMHVRYVQTSVGDLARFRLTYGDNEQLEIGRFSMIPGNYHAGFDAVEALEFAISSGDASWVHICPDVPDVFGRLCECSRTAASHTSVQIHESMLAMNLANVRAALSNADLVFCTERELCLLFGIDDLAHAAPVAQVVSGATYVVTSRSAVTVLSGDAVTKFRTSPVPAVDPTGAGDSFAGAFVAAQLAGSDLKGRVVRGMLAGLACVTDFGAERLLHLADA